ncbi:DNA-directed RNA polymerase II subunit RPB7 [Ceratobasidium sp. AG-Ba]|nr:DNA-directed RNA polymerase II subunit RPB7 [Ceratobasidium sp. AG-Ba]
MTTATPKPLKRKHLDGERDIGASGSVKKSKEERRAEKRAKRDAASESPVRRKSKANGIVSQVSIDKKEGVPSGSQFKLVRARTNISVPPRFVGDTRRGVEEILDNLVMRYVPSLQGVLLSHKNHIFSQDVAIIYAEGPFPTTTVDFDATVWAPEVGMRITGRISLHATDHIGLLVHRTFNASIARAHIPDNGEWEYVHGPAVNDPEFGTEDVQSDEEKGRWVHNQTGETLGGESGLVEFTVVGYTVANQMLSLHGSLQTDPFAPEHYVAKQNGIQVTEDDEPTAELAVVDRIQENSEEEVEAMEEETAVPRGKLRKVVDVVPVPPEPEVAPVRKKKKKKSIVGGEATVTVVEAAATVEEDEEKKKRKKKKEQAIDAE